MSVRSAGCLNSLDNFKAEEVVTSGYVMMMNCVRIAFQPQFPPLIVNYSFTTSDVTAGNSVICT